MRAPYLSNLKPEVARMVFRARVGVYDIKDNFKRKYDGDLNRPFCRQLHENFEHIFQCLIFSSANQGCSAGDL